jgi:endonuclease/exonuclease/phosphatase family metal-dependent hydrolase
LAILNSYLQLFINPQEKPGEMQTLLIKVRCKSVLVGNLNAKYPVWNHAVSNPSGKKLLQLFDISDFEISDPQYPTHYPPAGNGDVLDIVVHQNVRLSEVIVSDVLHSDHLPIIFHILDHVTITNLSDPVEKFTD